MSSRYFQECNYYGNGGVRPETRANSSFSAATEQFCSHAEHQQPHAHHQQLALYAMPIPELAYCGMNPALGAVATIGGSFWQPGARIVSPQRDEFYITKYLGKGGFAECYSVRTKPLDRDYDFAMKIIDKCRVKDISLSKINREIRLHSKMEHPHIVKLYNSFEDNRFFYLLLELCRDETLLCMINRTDGRGLPEYTSAVYMREILSAVQYLLSRKILHRDLKPGNVFIGKNGSVRLGDFGLAIELENCNPHSFSGTPNYLAPEILMKKGHSEKTEVWALGCMLYCMLTTRPPFETDQLDNTYARIRNNDYSFAHFPYVSHAARNFIAKCLEPDPKYRPTVYELFFNPWLDQSAASVNRTKSVNDIRYESSERSLSPPSPWTAPMIDAIDYIAMDVGSIPTTPEQASGERRHSGQGQLIQLQNAQNGQSIAKPPPIGWALPNLLKATRNGTSHQKHRSVRPKSTIDLRQALGREAERNVDRGLGTTSGGAGNSGSGRLFTARSQDSGFGSETDMSRMATMDHVLHALIHDVNAFLDGTLVAEFGAPPRLFVSKWVDYSNRRGFSCKLLDGTICVKFNEGSSLSYMRGSSHVTHVSSPFSTLQLKNVQSLTNDQPLFNQYNILLTYDDYMEKELATNSYIAGQLQRAQTEQQTTTASSTRASPHQQACLSDRTASPAPYLVYHTLIAEKYLVMIFNDCTVQVNLMDCRKKVILWRELVDSQDALLKATDQPEMIPLTAVSVIDNASNTSESLLLMSPEIYLTRKTVGRSRPRVGERVQMNLAKSIREAVGAINPSTFSRKSIYTTEC